MKTDLEKHILKLAIRRFFDPEGGFCIIDFDCLMKLAGIVPTTRERDALRLLHCVKYRDMDQELKRSLVNQIGEMLQRGPDVLIQLQESLEERDKVKPQVVIDEHWLRRLLSK